MNTRSFIPPTTAASRALPATASSVGGALRRFVLAATVAMLALGSASAFAWSQHGTAYTSRGTYNGARYGSCGGGSCSHAGGVAGPYGGFATNTGTVTRNAPGEFSEFGHRDRPLWQFGAACRRHQLRGRHLLTHRQPHRTGRQDGHDLRRRDQDRAGPVFIVRIGHWLERQHGRSFGIDELCGVFVLAFGHGKRFGRWERLSLRYGDAGRPGRCDDLCQRDRYLWQHRDDKRSGHNQRRCHVGQHNGRRCAQAGGRGCPCGLCSASAGGVCSASAGGVCAAAPGCVCTAASGCLRTAPAARRVCCSARRLHDAGAAPCCVGARSLGRERLGSGALVMSDSVQSMRRCGPVIGPSKKSGMLCSRHTMNAATPTQFACQLFSMLPLSP